MNDKKKLLVLVVDDQESFLDAVVDELKFLGFETMSAKDGLQGFELASKTKFDLILSDIRMPNKDGEWFLAELRKTQKTFPPFIFLTGFADLSVQKAYSMGADGFLAKPLNQDKFEALLEKFCLPLDARLSLPQKEKSIHHLEKSFSCSINDKDLKDINFGRGGLYLALPKLVFEVGDLISFKWLFNTGPIKNLEGVGRIVWKKENSEGISDEYGLYFEYLTPETLTSWSAYLKTQELIGVIPIGTNSGR